MSLKPHSAKYEDGNGGNTFLEKLVKVWYLVPVSSQCSAIASFIFY